MSILLSPVGEREVRQFEPAPRLGDLRGKRLALVWNGKQNGEVALRCVEERLRQRFPELTAELIRIGYGIPDDVLEAIRSRFGGAVAATAD